MTYKDHTRMHATEKTTPSNQVQAQERHSKYSQLLLSNASLMGLIKIINEVVTQK